MKIITGENIDYCEERRWLELPDLNFMKIFPDKIKNVKAIEYEGKTYFCELYSDDTKEAFIKFKCETIYDALTLRDDFRRNIQKNSLKVVK